jgi:hypothetical protein
LIWARTRHTERRATGIQAALRTERLTAPDAVSGAFAATTKAAVGIIRELNRQITDLEAALDARFEQHPDADIHLSQPGLGDVLGARVLGEFGDDPDRYASPKSRKNYAGDLHHQALRALGNRLVGILLGCLHHHTRYDEHTAWAHRHHDTTHIAA